MELKKIKSIENSGKQILAKRKEELGELRKLIDSDNAAVAAAAKQMEEATAKSDIAAYRESKAKKLAASDSLEMHSARYTALSKKPLISAKDYEKLVAECKAEVEAYNLALREKITKIADELYADGNEFKSAIEEANNVLYFLQVELYREADKPQDNQGNILHSTNIAKYEATGVLNWARELKNSHHYKKFAAKE